MRWLAVLAVAVMMAGCAEGVDDPQPIPAPDEPQRDPPKVTFSGDLANPFEGIAQERGSTLTDKPRQKPPLPFESNE